MNAALDFLLRARPELRPLVREGRLASFAHELERLVTDAVCDNASVQRRALALCRGLAAPTDWLLGPSLISQAAAEDDGDGHNRRRAENDQDCNEPAWEAATFGVGRCGRR